MPNEMSDEPRTDEEEAALLRAFNRPLSASEREAMESVRKEERWRAFTDDELLAVAEPPTQDGAGDAHPALWDLADEAKAEFDRREAAS